MWDVFFKRGIFELFKVYDVCQLFVLWFFVVENDINIFNNLWY